ncbi:S-methyl-5'-thioadenosine phosphorylase [Chloroflexota bacterium]
MTEKIALAVIGGSGLYDLPGLENVELKDLNTPFGKPSSQILLGSLFGRRIAFLARHGVGHQFSPSEVNYRANIFALKMLGTQTIISISACGSLREEYAPGDIVIPDQLFDHTHRRNRSFFGDGIVAHVSVGDPFCSRLNNELFDALKETGVKKIHQGGKLITIEGPRFSTKLESNVYRSWGMSLIGMTASPEAFLAREAEMCYSTMAHVTDYDVWHSTELSVSVEAVITILKENTNIAKKAINKLVSKLNLKPDCDCSSALESAILTQVSAIPPESIKKLDLLIGKYIQ